MIAELIEPQIRKLEIRFAGEGERWLGPGAVEATLPTVPPGAPEPPPQLLEPPPVAGNPLSRGRLLHGWALWYPGAVVAALAAMALVPDGLVLSASKIFPRGIAPAGMFPNEFEILLEQYRRYVTPWAIAGLILGVAAQYVGGRLLQRSRRGDALERAAKEHCAVIEGYVAELHAVRADGARASTEMAEIYRSRLPRMMQTAAALAQARADMIVICAPLSDLLRSRPSAAAGLPRDGGGVRRSADAGAVHVRGRAAGPTPSIERADS